MYIRGRYQQFISANRHLIYFSQLKEVSQIEGRREADKKPRGIGSKQSIVYFRILNWNQSQIRFLSHSYKKN